ncbi:MAG: phenylacetate--CoA ligase family protein [Candidatus Hydrogenedentes bacterium]|nr:phenylacetate--CoA ligase family protein [Candidatus Hydrogenedentota bacterium]
MYANALYKNAPIVLQSGLISLRAFARKMMREGRRFERQLEEIERTQYLSSDALASWHEAMLGKLLSHAVQHVPYYRELGLAGLVAKARPAEALAAFPIIDKAIVREHGARFMADNASRPLFKGSTSGTTGTPLTLYQDLGAINRENAFIWRQLEWAGLKRGERRAWLRGDLVVPVGQERPPFWRMNHAENMLMFSPCHLGEKSVMAYLDALTKFDPVIIQAYPSAVSFLAKWLESRNCFFGGSSLKGIVTSSETLDESLKDIIESRFRCRVFDWYGQFERVAAIGTCQLGTKHLVSDYSYVELVPSADGLVEIVGTGYNNFAMPLIRYRTGDFILTTESEHCKCGRAMPAVKRIVGRGDDFIQLRDGRLVGPLNNIMKGIQGILEAQFVLTSSDGIRVMVVPAENYDDKTSMAIMKSVRDRCGEQLHIDIETVPSILRSPNGKLRTLIRNEQQGREG